MKIYLDGVVNRHETDMAIVNDIVMQTGLDNAITDFRLVEDPLKNLDLKERLYQYDMVSQFFSGIFCIYHEDTYLYDHLTSVELNHFLQSGFLLEHTDPAEFETILYSSESGLKVLPEQGVSGYLAGTHLNAIRQTVIYAYPVAPRNVVTLVFVVDGRYYDKLLGDGESLRTDYILYGDEVIVFRGETEVDEGELGSALAVMGERGSCVKRFSSGKYLLTKRTGDSGLVYCTLQPMSVFNDKMVGGQWGIFAMLMLCSIPAALIITDLSRNMFGKVRSLNALLSEECGCNLETVELGIRTLMASKKEQEKENGPLRKSRLIRTLIKGDFEDIETVFAAAEQAGVNIRMPYYIVILMGAGGNSGERKTHEMMLKVIDNETLVDGYGVELLNRSQSLFVLFGEEEKFLDIILRFFLQIGRDYCEDFVLAVSAIHSDVMEVSKAYLEANSAFDSRLLMDNSDVIHFEALPVSESDISLSEVYLQQLKNAIYRKDEEGMREVVREICSQMRDGNQSLLKFRLLYHNMIHMLMKEWHMKESEVGEIYDIFALSRCLTLQNFNDILCEVCEKLMNGSYGKEKAKISRLADEAMDYMKAHYMEYELNMGSLAEHLKVTSTNLAVEFKNGTGMNPSDYLAGIRLERAKKLLIETDMLVKEISQAVGYEDNHMFMRRFKKYTGKTPGKYREENTRGGT